MFYIIEAVLSDFNSGLIDEVELELTLAEYQQENWALIQE